MGGQLGISRVLWIALFGSTLIYIAVLELTTIDVAADWQSLALMFAFGAVGSAGASLVAPRFVRRSASSGTQSPYLVALILSLALAESVSILGLVLGFMGAPPTVVLPFFVVTWVLMILRFPTQQRIDAFES
jgi:F0F1-type ATP synthase membrane subunit c/vacuolar-type H+-ATPase subunit K